VAAAAREVSSFARRFETAGVPGKKRMQGAGGSTLFESQTVDFLDSEKEIPANGQITASREIFLLARPQIRDACSTRARLAFGSTEPPSGERTLKIVVSVASEKPRPAAAES
jgi:hypothetical protein